MTVFEAKVGKYAGGNPVCDRPTPEWQKGIGTFLKKLPEKENKSEETSQDKDNDVECETLEAIESEPRWMVFVKTLLMYTNTFVSESNL